MQNREQLMEIMESADTDSSGTINYTEFIAATLEQEVYMKEENLRNAFRMFDKDGSGKISAEEMRDVLAGDLLDKSDLDTKEIDSMV